MDMKMFDQRCPSFRDNNKPSSLLSYAVHCLSGVESMEIVVLLSDIL